MNRDIAEDALNLYRIFLSLKRGVKIIAVTAGGFFILGLSYMLVSTPKYTASASIFLDRTQAETVAEISSNARRSFEHAAIESQVEIIKSRRVAEQAMRNLYSEQELRALESNYERREAVLKSLQRGLSAYREGESHVITIHYVDTDPKMAADKANGFAEAYIYDQINFFSEGSVKTATWLQNKIQSQREKSIEASRAVQKFRLENDLIDSEGSTINERQLSNMNVKLGNTKSAVAAARVRYEHSLAIVEKRDISAAVAAAFDNDVINNIRAKYLENEARLKRLQETLGGDHNAVKNQKRVLEDTREVIFGEMKRILQSHQSDYEVAQAEVVALEKSLQELIEKKLKNDAKKFELEALEKEAETHQNLYEGFLEKFETVNQQQSFPVSQSRIITYAVPPLRKSHPKTLVILALSIILGVGGGAFLALLKDNFDATIRRAGQVEKSLGLFFLGFLPKFGAGVALAQKSGRSLFKYKAYRQSVESARSLHADTSRKVKLRIDKTVHVSGGKVIGVISDTLHEGKSIVASNLALYAAQSGSVCLLIDADLKHPFLTKNNGLKKSGKQDHPVCKNLSFKDHLLLDDQTGLFVLPSDGEKGVSEEELMRVVQEARNVFDYIIVDLPPMSASSDTALFAQVIDGFLVALEWGKSLPNHLMFHLRQSGIEKDSILGAVISETDMKEMAENYRHRTMPEYVSVH